MSEVIVVTNVEHGWDCIVAVFDADSVSKESLESIFSDDDGYVVHCVNIVHKDTGGFSR